MNHSVEKWDFRGRGWRGSTSVFDERRVVTRRSALERVFFFFFFFLKRGFIFLDFDFRPGVW